MVNQQSIINNSDSLLNNETNKMLRNIFVIASLKGWDITKKIKKYSLKTIYVVIMEKEAHCIHVVFHIASENNEESVELKIAEIRKSPPDELLSNIVEEKIFKHTDRCIYSYSKTSQKVLLKLIEEYMIKS